jgi:hypothetical protein
MVATSIVVVGRMGGGGAAAPTLLERIKKHKGVNIMSIVACNRLNMVSKREGGDGSRLGGPSAAG